MKYKELIESNGLTLHGDIEHFAALVEEAARADEREECAKLCDEYAIGLERNYSEIIAEQIRARRTT